jgi:hypothetical protein
MLSPLISSVGIYFSHSTGTFIRTIPLGLQFRDGSMFLARIYVQDGGTVIDCCLMNVAFPSYHKNLLRRRLHHKTHARHRSFKSGPCGLFE